jgi:hypothetical protein
MGPLPVSTALAPMRQATEPARLAKGHDYLLTWTSEQMLRRHDQDWMIR